MFAELMEALGVWTSQELFRELMLSAGVLSKISQDSLNFVAMVLT